ncbi:hypothetical protein [Yoonia sediminilitoris]|uniref:Uncharacterized protein n=1 Tax=Yoonia sediminilitoris TaxID=1286148 RepID=A0A2T6KPQ4_9RHOB|nr:hypothetical protein [Yoonia sediminilitoris]PUB18537.1 hypothetical protein C8N45_101121 [Yoonia sediminilitoris]RCW98705.1 hypothetical protein DFP92_101121 [Yoonia sediminilitoris]
MDEENQDIAKLFTRTDGSYVFARWGRPIAPVIFGVDDATLAVFKGAVEAVVTLANHKMDEVDTELGANLMVFFCRDWAELTEVPHLDQLVPDLGPLVGRLQQADANQYRIFRFDEAGAIRACFVFLRMDDHLSRVSADVLALSQAVQMIVLWSDSAFDQMPPLAMIDGKAVLRPHIADVVRAAYDPVMPLAAQDASHALRLAARVGRLN